MAEQKAAEKPKYPMIVKKAFVLSTNPRNGKLPVEVRFGVGTHMVDEEVINHPYVASGADGHIESPEETKARLESIKKEQAVRAEIDAKALKDAEASFARAQASSGVKVENDAEVQKQLNTPVNELGKNAGTDVDKGSADADTKADAKPKAGK